MSAYIVNLPTLHCALHGIATLPTFAGISLPSNPADGTALLTVLGRRLWRLNAAAVADRYPSQTVELDADAFAFDPDLRPTQEQMRGGVECLAYQCAEGSAVRDPLYKALCAAEESVAAKFPEGRWGVSHMRDIPSVSPALRAAQLALNSLLVSAAEQGDDIALARAIEDGADPDSRDGHGIAALTHAVLAGHGKAVRELLSAGADADAGDGQPLADAARYGHAAIITRLLAAGADTLKSGCYAKPPLYVAAQLSRPDCVRALLEGGARVDGDILDRAEQMGDEEVSELLSTAYASQGAPDEDAAAADIAAGRADEPEESAVADARLPF